LAHGDDVQLAFRQPLAAEEVSALVVQMESYGFDVVSAAKDGSDVVSMRLTDRPFYREAFDLSLCWVDLFPHLNWKRCYKFRITILVQSG